MGFNPYHLEGSLMVRLTVQLSDAEFEALHHHVYSKPSRPDITMARFVQELVVRHLAKEHLKPTAEEVQGIGYGI